MTKHLSALWVVAALLAGCAATPTPTDIADKPTPVPQTASADSQATPAAAAEPQPSQMAAAKRASRLAGSGLDADDEAARKDLWVRVRRGFAIPDLDTDLVRRGEQWYVARPDYVARMTERSSRYMFYIVEEIERRGMPTELALLPFIESAFNPQAISSAKASGMWQFMSATGKDYDLKQNVFRDDRRSVLDSTRAALDYLSRLHDQFGDWQLALAAYNWGEGSVSRAIARNQKAGLPTDYLSLRMPLETQYYVPKLQAVKNIIARPERYGLTLPPLENHPYFLSVAIERDIDVALAAKFAGMSLEEFKTLNPQMNKPVILAAGTPQVLLPYDNANEFVRRHAAHRGPLATWTAWVAPKTMRPSDVAQQHGMNESALRELNRIPPRMLVKAGSTLLVPRSSVRTADVSEHVADNAMMALAPDVPPQRKLSLRAGKRDTVASIAKRYRLSPAQVAQWNKTSPQARFKAGQSVIVYVPVKAGGRVAAGSSRKAGRVQVAQAPSAKSKAGKRMVKVAATRTVAKPAAKSSARRVAQAARPAAGRHTMRAGKY